MNDPQNLYCRAWQYLFEIVTVAKNDCILTDSDRGRCQRTFLRPKRHADPERDDHCRNRYTDPADRCSQRCYCNRFLPALCRSIFLRWRKQLSVLFGLVVGYIVAIAMGVVDFSALQGTSIIALPRLMPFKPEFNLNAIISVTLIFLVSATETIGDTSALAASGLNREASIKETSGSIACDGFISALSSVFGCRTRLSLHSPVEARRHLVLSKSDSYVHKKPYPVFTLPVISDRAFVFFKYDYPVARMLRHWQLRH